MRLSEAALPMFARHETFHPRYGWFRKAYEAALDSADTFSNPEATVELGVGKNMVKSIRFWGTAAKLIANNPNSPNKRTPGVAPTELGKLLFNPTDGWDPFMEHPATLWLLHWNLLAKPCHLPVWWVAFNQFVAVEFDATDLESACASALESAAEWKTPHASSVHKDITAMLRTYAPPERSTRNNIDDMLNCPLRELGLVAKSLATGNYRFTMGLKPSLVPAVVAYAALDFVARANLDAANPTGANTSTQNTAKNVATKASGASQTALLSRLANEAGSPGKAFKLTESELAVLLGEAAQDSHGQLALASPAGATQLVWDGDPAKLGIEMLNSYYKNQCVGDLSAPQTGMQSNDELGTPRTRNGHVRLASTATGAM
ncbi:MAG: DUF4007 family protein [bacterium]|nr:DUF4007 family protein [bacterium]MCY4163933.1 DUF4007 family protein [bacterium]